MMLEVLKYKSLSLKTSTCLYRYTSDHGHLKKNPKIKRTHIEACYVHTVQRRQKGMFLRNRRNEMIKCILNSSVTISVNHDVNGYNTRHANTLHEHVIKCLAHSKSLKLMGVYFQEIVSHNCILQLYKTRFKSFCWKMILSQQQMNEAIFICYCCCHCSALIVHLFVKCFHAMFYIFQFMIFSLFC